mgnify:FL=1
MWTPALGRLWRKISLKKYIFTILILLIFFTNAFCQVPDEDWINNMTIDEVKKNIISFYSEEISGRKFLNIIPKNMMYKKTLLNDKDEISSLITSDFNLNEEKVVFAKRFFTILEEYENWCLLIQYENTSKKEFDIVIVSFDNKSYVKYKDRGYVYINFLDNQHKTFLFIDTVLQKQISNFQLLGTSGFVYDFNHDGSDEVLIFEQGGQGQIHRIYSYDKILFDFWRALPCSDKCVMEFINYNTRQGIKCLDDCNNWLFYYYDRIQQKYVQDESASSEELEQIHGSPDFFAEAGIDYAKLERPLVPSDLEGFSKAALRIWRNAVYARHGRTFKSEDLQALFNEYAWYKPDNEYTDDKLTDIDRANIKLIQEFEKK